MAERYPWEWDQPYDPYGAPETPETRRGVIGEQPNITPGTGTQTAPPVEGSDCTSSYGTPGVILGGQCLEKRQDDPGPKDRSSGTPESLPGSGLPYKPKYNFAPVPKFDAPEFDYQGRPIPEFNPTSRFAPPTPGSIYDDPSYQFRYEQGAKALDAKAAARGGLRTGGQIKSLEDYRQNMASQEYGNIYGRARDTYNAQYGQEQDIYNARLGEYGLDFGGYKTAFDANYQGARDEYAPLFSEWQTLTAVEQRAADLELQYMWDEWKRNNPSWNDLNNAIPQG